MNRGRLIAGLLALTLFVAASQPPRARPYATPEDASSVRDVQRIVADMLGDTDARHDGDVNGDGQVDVLDLQRALSLANNADAPAAPPLPTPEVKATTTSAPKPPLPATLRRSLPFTIEAEHSTSSRSEARCAPEAIPREIFRRLYMLSPNAPPATWLAVECSKLKTT